MNNNIIIYCIIQNNIKKSTKNKIIKSYNYKKSLKKLFLELFYYKQKYKILLNM